MLPSERASASAGADYVCKIPVVGRPRVGKTSMLARLLKSTYDPQVGSTIGVDFVVKVKQHQPSGLRIKIQGWDCVHHNLPSLSQNKMLYSNSDVVLACFDLSDPDSIHTLLEIAQSRPAPEHTPWVLVGLKLDLVQPRHDPGVDAPIALPVMASSRYDDGTGEAKGEPQDQIPPTDLRAETPLPDKEEAARLELKEHFKMSYLELSAQSGQNVEVLLGFVLGNAVTRQLNQGASDTIVDRPGGVRLPTAGVAPLQRKKESRCTTA